MTSKKRRRIINTALLLIACAAMFLGYLILEISLRNDTIFTGFVLIALVLFLTFFNARKKFNFFPMLKVSTWTQIHIYCGYFCAFVFVLHVDFAIPQGVFEQILAVVFLVVTISGFFGLFISRWLPKRLNKSGETLTYERLPGYRYELRKEAESLILRAEKEAGSSSIGDLYMKYLDSYFRYRPTVWVSLGGIPNKFHRMVEHIESSQRYLNPQEKEIAGDLLDLVESKRNVDYQDSSMRLLKMWLFIHIPFTYSMLLLSAVHVYYALAYGGRF